MDIPEKENKKQSAVAVAIGSIGLALASALLGFEFGRRSVAHLAMRGSQIHAPKEIQSRFNAINRETDIHHKMEVIGAHVTSNDWLDRLGGILVCLSELELFLEQAVLLADNRRRQAPRNYFKRVSLLRAKGYLNPVEYDLLRKISPVRNDLVHGRYSKVIDEDIVAVYHVIKTLFENHIRNRGIS